MARGTIKSLLGAVLLLALLALGGFSVLALQRVGVAQGYAPEQPIAFSHLLHAGESKVPCLYCHFAAERSRHAGIPPLEVCMNCHRELKAQTIEIAKLKEAVRQSRPIAWVKVHNLPDFVAFDHSRHVTAGVACQECHGPVETMDRVRQHSPLTMGWCLDCHRTRAQPAELQPTLVTPRPLSGIGLDCSNCHL